MQFSAYGKHKHHEDDCRDIADVLPYRATAVPERSPSCYSQNCACPATSSDVSVRTERCTQVCKAVAQSVLILYGSVTQCGQPLEGP